MKKILKIVLILLAVFLVIHTGLDFWLESRLKNLINSNSDRSYNINYEDIGINWKFDAATINTLTIEPVTSNEKKTRITGQAKRVAISGMEWWKLLWNDALILEEMELNEPEFFLQLDTAQQKRSSGRSFQDLFADILSRASLDRFRLADGKMQMSTNRDNDTTKILSASKINILANGLRTDSVRLQYLIPFKLDDLEVSFKNVQFIPDEFTALNIEAVDFTSNGNLLKLNKLSVDLNSDRLDISRQVGYQKDIIEMEVKEIEIRQLQTRSSLYDSLNIAATNLIITDLDMNDLRNKNLDRPDEPEKPLLNGLIKKIPFPIRIDTDTLENCKIEYSEISKGSIDPGVITFADINGSITGITNQPNGFGENEHIEVHLTSRVYSQSTLDLNIRIPYEGDRFYLDAALTDIPLISFNQILNPLTGFSIDDGNLARFHLTMETSRYTSNNSFLFNYNKLEVSMADEPKIAEDLGILS